MAKEAQNFRESMKNMQLMKSCEYGTDHYLAGFEYGVEGRLLSMIKAVHDGNEPYKRIKVRFV